MKSSRFIVTLTFILSVFYTQKATSQTTTAGADIKAITTAVPAFAKVLLFDGSAKNENKTKVDVPEVDATIVIQYKATTIEEIEVITGAYDAKYDARITRNRIGSVNGQLAQFLVQGHPKGPFVIDFKEVTEADTQARGRQKNRRVEMTIEFD